jgi:hypothetical protein
MKTKERAKKTKPERLAPMLASEIGLTCKQYRQVKPGKYEKCNQPAVGYVQGGDSCDDHRERPQVRYATARRAVVKKAA